MTIALTLAKEIKKYVDKYKKMPNLIKIKDIGYNQNQMAYRLAYAVCNKQKDVPKGFHIDGPNNPVGNKWNKKVPEKYYLDLAKRYVAFVDKNRKTPNYAALTGRKVAITLFIYEMARILISYNVNKKLPATCTFDSAHVRGTTTEAEKKAKYAKKKHGHATASGCDNRGQNNGYYCACHSLQEVFRNLTGIVVPQSTIAGWAGTTENGTGHFGIDTAIAMFNKKYNKNLVGKWYNFSDLGWSGLKELIKSNNKDFIIHNNYRLRWGHYEVVNDIYDSTVDVQNSLGDYCDRGCYCGYVENRSKSEYRSYINGISQKSILVIANV